MAGVLVRHGVSAHAEGMGYHMMTIFRENMLAGKTCIVTGGGTGIGLATAEMLLQTGARVALLGRREDVVRAAAKQLDPTLANAWWCACDIRDNERVEHAVQQVQERMGPVHVLINNAGGQFPSPAEGISSRGFEAVVRNNLLGTWNMTRAVALQSMLSHGGGAIVNVIANMARGFPGMAHTGAARAGVENLTRTLAVEWVSRGVRVNAVAPGIIQTDALAQYPSDVAELGRKATPMRRLGIAQEVAASVVFLCSPAAEFITGITLPVDGGARLWGDIWPIPDPLHT